MTEAEEKVMRVKIRTIIFEEIVGRNLTIVDTAHDVADSIMRRFPAMREIAARGEKQKGSIGATVDPDGMKAHLDALRNANDGFVITVWKDGYRAWNRLDAQYSERDEGFVMNIAVSEIYETMKTLGDLESTTFGKSYLATLPTQSTDTPDEG